MEAKTVGSNRVARSQKPLKFTLDGLLAEKKQREQSQVINALTDAADCFDTVVCMYKVHLAC